MIENYSSAWNSELQLHNLPSFSFVFRSANFYALSTPRISKPIRRFFSSWVLLVNIWFCSFLNDRLIFTLIKLTLIRLFPILLLLLGIAPTHKLIFDNSKLNLPEDAFQSIALRLATKFPSSLASTRKRISPGPSFLTDRYHIFKPIIGQL